MKGKNKPMMNKSLKQLLETSIISSNRISQLTGKQLASLINQSASQQLCTVYQADSKSDDPCQTKQSIRSSQQSKTFKETGDFDKKLMSYMSVNIDPLEKQDQERGYYQITSCQLRKYPPLPSKRKSQRNYAKIRVKSQILSNSSDIHQQVFDQKRFKSTDSEIQITQKLPTAISYPRNKHFYSVQSLDSHNNFHIELYQRAKRQSFAKQQWVQKQKKFLQRQVLKQCTHSPNINQMSKQIAKRVKTCYNQSFRQLSRSSLQNKQHQQIKQCSFQPKINALSKKIVLNRNQNQPNQTIFEHLYEDSKFRNITKNKSQIDSLNHKRMPSIDKLSQKIVGKSKFSQRMQFYQSQKKRKKLSLQKQNQQQNRNLYKPKIGKAPRKYNSQKLPIGQFLYQKAKQNTTKQIIDQKKKLINETSVKCYQRKKAQCFQRIFNILDDDNDGEISFIDINIIGLPRQILQIVKPILYQLQIMEAKLNYQQFMLSMDKLFTSLTINQRNVLLDNKKKTFVDDYCFKPNLNAKSKQIASQIDRDKVNIYEFCAIKQKLKNKYLNEERLQKRKHQMQKCTFYPKIKYYRC